MVLKDRMYTGEIGISSKTFLPLIIAFVAGCATAEVPASSVEAPISRVSRQKAQKKTLAPQKRILKRKIAVGRFTNETRYGKTFLRDGDTDPLGKQASDMLINRLVSSMKFLVFERPDISKIKHEQGILKESNLIGVDALILGSVTEFGRSTTGKTGFLSATKKQTAQAKVEIRMVDVRTGHVFFSASGAGEASTESGEVAGFGNRADYDATLNDKAIGAAISDLLNSVISKLDERVWRTDILRIKRNEIFIAGGKRQGIKIGDILSVMREGERVKSKQTGFKISLPATKVGEIRIISLFGDSETNEGAVGTILFGTFRSGRTNDLFVSDGGK